MFYKLQFKFFVFAPLHLHHYLYSHFLYQKFISNTYLPEFLNILLYVKANPVWMCC